MKNYRITVNGTAYDVAVEELDQVSTSVPMQPAAPVVEQAAQAAPVASEKKAVSVQPASAGAITVESPMPGKIVAVKVTNAQTVKKGDVIVVLEAMKMENEIVAPEDGTVASVNVAEGASVETGETLATMNA